ncbi:hypothetical protein P7C70_g5610, partial [Phenoliferia sp. Uapishka_3]
MSSSYGSEPTNYTSYPNSAEGGTNLPPGADPFASHADAYPIAPNSNSDRRMSTVRESIGGEIRATSPPMERSGTPVEEDDQPRKLGVVNLPDVDQHSTDWGKLGERHD